MEQRLKSIEAKLDFLLKKLDGKSTQDTASKPKRVNKIEKSGSAIVTIYNDLIIVTGNTYSNKDNLKSVGARWNKEQKGWQFNTSSLDTVSDKVAEVFESTSFKEVNKDISTSSVSTEEKVNYHRDEECTIDSDSD